MARAATARKLPLDMSRVMRDLWDNRVDFVKYIIGATPTDQQGDGLRALDENDHVSIKSGHGPGKSTVASWSILHYMCCRPDARIPCTAPSKHQLDDVLWSELSKWHRKMNPDFALTFIWTKEKFAHKDRPELWFAAARTATKENPDALQGFHGDYVFRVEEEASGIPESIFEVLDGATGLVETKELMIGNPTKRDGNFFDSHNKLKKFYKTLTWSCLKSPIVPARFIERMAKKFGEDSNIYRVRVLGEFPLQDGDSFIPYHLAAAALEREIDSQAKYHKVFGVDVARYGEDDTVIAIRQGDEFFPYRILKQKSTMQVVTEVARLANVEKPEKIFIDVIGIGAGVFDRLEELGYPVIGVSVSESPSVNSRDYKRLRDELWGNMRSWLESGRAKLWDNEDQDLIGQLTTPKYGHTSDSKIVIETKDQLKKRGIVSPDIAEAHLMTFAQPVADYTREDDFEDDLRGSDDGPRPLDAEAGY